MRAIGVLVLLLGLVTFNPILFILGLVLCVIGNHLWYSRYYQRETWRLAKRQQAQDDRQRHDIDKVLTRATSPSARAQDDREAD